MRIAVINGPNLNLLGQREPEIYGTTTLPEIEARLREVAAELDTAISFAHTSLAIHDALTSVSVPFAEVHLSNIYARGPERSHSLLADAAVGVIAGFGAMSYELALRGLVNRLAAND